MQFHTPPNALRDAITTLQNSPFFLPLAIGAGAILCVILATYVTRK